MHHVAVGLDLHQLVDRDPAVLAHAPEVVAPQVDEHHVLGALLLVGEQLLGDPAVVLGGVAPRGRVPAIGLVARPGRPADRQQRLRARARDLEVAEVQEVHVRARVDRAQPAVDRERLDRRRAPTSAGTARPGRRRRRGCTRRSARPSLRTARARHVRLELGIARATPPAARPRGTGAGERARTSRDRRARPRA